MSGAGEAARSAWVERVLGVRMPGEGAPKQAGVEAGGQAGWTRARGVAVAGLSALEGAVKGSPHPGRDRAIILLRAVRANLTVMPDSLRQVAELRRYLMTDDVVDAAEGPNVFGMRVALRTPLLDALDGLQVELARGGAR